MFVEVLGNVPEGQVVRHAVALKNLVPVHVRQSPDVAPLQVPHVESQLSQVLVDEFSKRVLVVQAVRQLVPSRNLPFGHVRH